jgi:hypothetical protein
MPKTPKYQCWERVAALVGPSRTRARSAKTTCPRVGARSMASDGPGATCAGAAEAAALEAAWSRYFVLRQERGDRRVLLGVAIYLALALRCARDPPPRPAARRPPPAAPRPPPPAPPPPPRAPRPPPRPPPAAAHLALPAAAQPLPAARGPAPRPPRRRRPRARRCLRLAALPSHLASSGALPPARAAPRPSFAPSPRRRAALR